MSNSSAPLTQPAIFQFRTRNWKPFIELLRLPPFVEMSHGYVTRSSTSYPSAFRDLCVKIFKWISDTHTQTWHCDTYQRTHSSAAFFSSDLPHHLPSNRLSTVYLRHVQGRKSGERGARCPLLRRDDTLTLLYLARGGETKVNIPGHASRVHTPARAARSSSWMKTWVTLGFV